MKVLYTYFSIAPSPRLSGLKDNFLPDRFVEGVDSSAMSVMGQVRAQKTHEHF